MQIQTIQNKIYQIRGERIMLDFDLAEMYEVETRVLKQAVRRNLDRFPQDFMFQLTDDEIDNMVSQSVIPSKSKLEVLNLLPLPSKAWPCYQAY